MPDDLQLWVPVVLEQPVGKARLGLEVQPRMVNNVSELAAVRVRPSLTYDINQHLSLTVGYLWSPVFSVRPQSGPTRYEQRIWQQAMLTHMVGRRVRVNHQLRLEERFIPQTDPVALRGRYLIRGVVPLGQTRWLAVASNEVLWNINDVPGAQAGFSQNRLFGGLRRQLTPHVFMEGGYMLQLIDQPTPAPTQANHIVVVRLQATLPRWLDKPKAQQPASPINTDPPSAPVILD
jgi:hypothetical protein